MKKAIACGISAALAAALSAGAAQAATLSNSDGRVYIWRSPEAYHQMVTMVNQHAATPAAVGPLLACIARNGVPVSGGFGSLVHVDVPSEYVTVGDHPCSGYVISEDVH